MEAQLRTCAIYVDYEGLLVGLSYCQCLEIDSVLLELLQKARQQYRVLRAVVLGTWLQQESRELLTSLGYICRVACGSEQEITCVLQDHIVESLLPVADEAVDVFIFVGGKANRIELLRQVCLVQKSSVLWTLDPPTLTERLLCSEWEQISYPDREVSWSWPHQVMLHALVLVADTLHGEAGTTFSHKSLCEQLNQFKPFNNNALYWLLIAMREQIVLLPQAGTHMDLPAVRLNRQHVITRKAFFIKERILMTLNVMLSNRDWVAFSALEKALGMTFALTQSQDYRQAWLDLLVSTGALLTRTVPHPEGSFIVTTLSFNRDQHVLAIVQEQEKRNLQRFIIATNDFIVRCEQQSIKRTSLASMLLKTMTYIEAHGTFRKAMEQDIAHSSQCIINKSISSNTRIWLNGTHPLVQMTLNRRDQLILLCYSLLLSGNGRVSASTLAEELTLKSQVDAGETLFWIYLLIDEGILVRDRTGSGTVLRMKRQDAVIKRALDQLN